MLQRASLSLSPPASASPHRRAPTRRGRGAAPAAMVYQEGSRASSTGAKLFTVSYQPEGAAQAALIFHHGLGEHIGRYTASE